MKKLITFILMHIVVNTNATTNLGTLNTVRNGFATLKECSRESGGQYNCKAGPLDSLKDVLSYTTTNQCLATKADFKEKKLSIPHCPDGNGQLSGLDNTHPTVGTFALYTGSNDNFIHNLASSYLNGSAVGRFNLVLPKSQIDNLKKNSDLIKILNSPRVNIVEVETMPKVDKWMQDSFQFATVNGKPAIYQLEHFREQGSDFENRLACELAKKCDIPYYIPPDMVDPTNKDLNSLNSGGNLEILPGGTFYTGIIKTDGFDRNLPGGEKVPFRTKFQEIQKKSLETSGNKVLELDTSFLSVGHVDEIINIVKTNKPSPCDYAVLLASPKKAFDLMEESANKITKKSTFIRLQDFIFPVAHAQLVPLVLPTENKCTRNSYYNLSDRGRNQIMNSKEVDTIYNDYCIDGEPIESYVTSNEFQILKRENLLQSEPANIAKIMEENKKALIEELKSSTQCESPQVIEIPVFFRNGLSYTPDLVNGVVETPPGSPSNVYLPRTYFKPFDDYVRGELSKFGVDTNFVHDMGYHLQQGEVHCGTNTARICNL